MTTGIHSLANETSGTILTKLEAALNSDGDFPVRARVVNDLRRLVNDPNTPVEKIVEVVLSEPSLGTRILHLVNSVYYQRSRPILTVSQAVVQLGMRALADLCAGFVLMQRFSPAAQRGGVFADNVKKCILTSTITCALALEVGEKENAEQGYLGGTFFSIGPLLLAYYFPQVFESAEKRALARGQTVSQSITETLGIAPVGLSLGVVDALAIPQYYQELLVAAYNMFVEEHSSVTAGEYRGMANSLATAAQLAEAIIDTHDKAQLAKQLDAISQHSGFSPAQISTVLSHTPESFKQHCKMIEMSFLVLPEHFLRLLEEGVDGTAAATDEESGVGDEFSFYLDEMREAIANRETMSSIITTAMEALAFGQKFDRVLLLFADTNHTNLTGRMALGKAFPQDPKTINRHTASLDPELAPDVKALNEGTAQTFGDPLFEDGWPFAAVPIGSGERAIGVIYADMLTNKTGKSQPLDGGVQVALHLLAELLEEALTINT